MKFFSLVRTKEKHDNENDLNTNKEALKAEFKSARRFGEGRMGKQHLFYRYFINVKYVSWDKIRKAYLRVESGESGEFLLKEFYLMLHFDDMCEGKLRFEREENVRNILEHMTRNYPHIEIGYKR